MIDGLIVWLICIVGGFVVGAMTWGSILLFQHVRQLGVSLKAAQATADRAQASVDLATQNLLEVDRSTRRDIRDHTERLARITEVLNEQRSRADNHADVIRQLAKEATTLAELIAQDRRGYESVQRVRKNYEIK